MDGPKALNISVLSFWSLSQTMLSFLSVFLRREGMGCCISVCLKWTETVPFDSLKLFCCACSQAHSVVFSSSFLNGTLQCIMLCIGPYPQASLVMVYVPALACYEWSLTFLASGIKYSLHRQLILRVAYWIQTGFERFFSSSVWGLNLYCVIFFNFSNAM